MKLNGIFASFITGASLLTVSNIEPVKASCEGAPPTGDKLVITLKGEGSTAILDLKEKKVLKTIKNTTSVSHGIAISPDNKYAFISVEGIGGEPGIVDVIDLESLDLVSSVKVGKQAGGIAFWKISD